MLRGLSCVGRGTGMVHGEVVHGNRHFLVDLLQVGSIVLFHEVSSVRVQLLSCSDVVSHFLFLLTYSCRLIAVPAP